MSHDDKAEFKTENDGTSMTRPRPKLKAETETKILKVSIDLY